MFKDCINRNAKFSWRVCTEVCKHTHVNRTKIICTAGPSVETEDKLIALVKAGMSVIRFNCSHGTSAWRLKVLRRIRRVEKKMGRPIGVMLDLQGPKMRVGDLPQPVQLNVGEVWRLAFHGRADSNGKVIPIPVDLAPGVAKDGYIYMHDGLICTRVIRKDAHNVWVRVIHGGVLESRKGINIPFYRGKLAALSRRDIMDALWGLKHRVDFIALSFVRAPADILRLKKLINRADSGYRPLIVSKIEKPEAVDNLDGIIAVSDSVLVARGDLGIELKQERVPVVQKQIIERCRHFKKPVIVATQMLDSMRVHPVPTRAEVSDVASAIYAGTDAAMLTGETSTGKYPVQTTAMMNRIIGEVENHMIVKTFRKRPDDFGLTGPEEAFVFNVMQTADDINAKAIVVLNRRGIFTRVLSKLHPKQPVYSMALTHTAYRQLSLYWGVFPIEVSNKNTARRIAAVTQILKNNRTLKKGERVIYLYRDFQTDYLNLKVVEG